MICQRAVYKNFRNICDEMIEFSPDVNLICGQNAQGKTNALEGIYLMAGGRSYRASREREMIRFGSDEALVRIDYTDRMRESNMEVRIFESGRRVCSKNGMNIRKMSEFIGNFHAVLFTPEHLSIVKDGPSVRRGFLDSAISQLSSGYVASLQAYNRVLLQRNRLLSQIADGIVTSDDTLDIWSDRLIAEAVKISAARDRYVSALSELVGDIFADMTGGREQVRITYPCRKDADAYRADMAACRTRERATGTTHFGAHKDDIDITLNGRPVRAYGSQGQQRSVALAMKLAEGELSRKGTGEYPIFLFDDILSELDSARKSYILSGIAGRQVIITACDINAAPGANIIRCENGRYC